MSKSNNPKLILLTGRAGSGKTYRCLNELITHLELPSSRLSREVLYLLPTAEHRERITDLLLRKSVPGFFGNVVSTFDELLDSLLRFGEIDFASDITRKLILKELIQSIKLDYFKEAAHTNGFVNLLSGIITEFKEALMAPSDFERMLPDLKKLFPHFAQKYEELYRIYSGYEKRLSALNLKDRHDALFLLEEKLKSGSFNLNRFRFKKIWLDGFFDFSNLQMSFIRLLAAYSDQMTVTLTHDSNLDRQYLFRISAETRTALLQMGFCEEKLEKVKHRFQSQTLRHVEQNLFNENLKQKISADASVVIYDGTGIAGELEMIAREIKRIVMNEKIHFSDCALLFRNVSPYLNALQNVFAKYEIPIEIHEREELRLNPLAKTCVSLINILVNDWLREDIFNLFKSGYWKIDRDFVWACEKSSLKEGILKGKNNWLARYENDAFKQLSEWQELLLKSQGASKLANTFERVLERLGVTHVPAGLNLQNQKDHAALRRIRGLLREVTRKYGSQEFSFSEFAEVFTHLIEVDLFAFHSRDKNKVQIYNISLARQKEYKVVFIPGLLEKSFPVQIKEDPILSDSERRLINQNEIVLRERLPRQSLEKFFFYLAATRASEKLYLTYPRFDLEGKEALPSFYIEEVKQLFSAPLTEVQQSISDVLPPIRLTMTKKEAASQLIQLLWHRGKILPHFEREVIRAFYNALCDQSWFQLVVKALLHPLEARISDARINQLLCEENTVLSASKLETYAECPYRFFADYSLGLEEQENKIDSRIVGTILHEALEKFHKWWIETGASSAELIKQKSSEFLSSTLKSHPISGDFWYRIELQRKKIEEMLFRVIDIEIIQKQFPLENLKPRHFEFAFDEKSNPLQLTLNGSSILIRGKIDRIDVDSTGTYGLVIDYKTGKKFEFKTLKQGTQLQLIIYLLAAEQLLNLKPIGGHLYVLSKAESGGFHHAEHIKALGIKKDSRTAWPDDKWQALIRQSIERIFDYADGIKQGDIAVRPRNCAEFCPYSSVCRIEPQKLNSIYRERKNEDASRYKIEQIA